MDNLAAPPTLRWMTRISLSSSAVGLVEVAAVGCLEDGVTGEVGREPVVVVVVAVGEEKEPLTVVSNRVRKVDNWVGVIMLRAELPWMVLLAAAMLWLLLLL